MSRHHSIDSSGSLLRLFLWGCMAFALLIYLSAKQHEAEKVERRKAYEAARENDRKAFMDECLVDFKTAFCTTIWNTSKEPKP